MCVCPIAEGDHGSRRTSPRRVAISQTQRFPSLGMPRDGAGLLLPTVSPAVKLCFRLYILLEKIGNISMPELGASGSLSQLRKSSARSFSQQSPRSPRLLSFSSFLSPVPPIMARTHKGGPAPVQPPSRRFSSGSTPAPGTPVPPRPTTGGKKMPLIPPPRPTGLPKEGRYGVVVGDEMKALLEGKKSEGEMLGLKCEYTTSLSSLPPPPFPSAGFGRGTIRADSVSFSCCLYYYPLDIFTLCRQVQTFLDRDVERRNHHSSFRRRSRRSPRGLVERGHPRILGKGREGDGRWRDEGGLVGLGRG